MRRTTYVRIIIVGCVIQPPPPRCQALANGAWLEGTLTKRVRIGDAFHLRCVLMNGRLCKRVYQSSTVVSIKGDTVVTEQMRYKVLRVPKFNPEQSLRAWEE